jgi:exopolysaccharide biosynthesis polyprenyl glycosylphosphotransferase
MLHETVEATRTDVGSWAPGNERFAFSRRRRTLDRLRATALPALCIFAANAVVVVTHDKDPRAIVSAAILTLLYLAGLELIGRSTWLSPLALGVPVTTAFGIVLALPAIALVGFWIPGFDVSRLELLLVTFSTYAVWTLYWSWPSASLRKAPQRVLVVGRADGGRELVEELQARHDLPFECEGFVDDDPAGGGRWLGDLDDLGAAINRQGIDIVVFADASLRDRAMPVLLDAGRLDIRVVGLADFYEHAFGRVPVDRLSQTWFMSLLYLYRGGYPSFFKRVFDVAFASVMLLFTAPLFPLIALLIVVETRGPVFFRQVRVGEGGDLFEILKFRTMVDGAEDEGRALWAQENDGRITRVGKVLRKTRLDELPQLWNVLRGEMSVVGPRPERPEFLELLEQSVPHWTRRHLVKPGITGWAQVCCGYTSDAASALDKLSYDLYYIKHRSPTLDFAVVAKTVTVMLSGSGAK